MKQTKQQPDTSLEISLLPSLCSLQAMVQRHLLLTPQVVKALGIPYLTQKDFFFFFLERSCQSWFEGWSLPHAKELRGLCSLWIKGNREALLRTTKRLPGCEATCIYSTLCCRLLVTKWLQNCDWVSVLDNGWLVDTWDKNLVSYRRFKEWRDD